MNKLTSITWFILIALTLTTALFSSIDMKFKAFMIMGLAILKFIGVVFQFMELKKAHSFWKGAIFTFLIVFISITLILI